MCALYTMDPYRSLNAGDVVAFTYRGERKTAAVHPMLVFTDHVVVRFTGCGYVVDDSNYLGLVRKARKARAS